MKNIFLTLASLLMFSSCTQTNDLFENKMNISNNELFSKVVSLNDLTEQKLVFRTLSSFEKFMFWKAKFNLLIDNNEFNVKQLNFINQFINLLSENKFEKGSNEYEVFKNYELAEIEKKGSELFNKEQLYYIFYSFENPENLNENKIKYRIKKKNKLQASKVIPECDCTTTCRRITGVSLFGISWEIGKCDTGPGCVDDGWGCGALGLWGCNGGCKY